MEAAEVYRLSPAEASLPRRTLLKRNLYTTLSYQLYCVGVVSASPSLRFPADALTKDKTDTIVIESTNGNSEMTILRSWF